MKKRPGSGRQQLSWFVPLALLLVLGILIVTGILLRGLRQQHPQITLPEMPSLPRVLRRQQAEAPRRQQTTQTPQVAIIIDDVGWSTEMAARLERLGEPLTASVLPLGETSEHIARKLASCAHMEVMLHMPMEPLPPVRPDNRLCLLTRMDDGEIAATFDEAISPYAPFVRGINNHMGSAFTTDEARMRTFLLEVKKRNLYFVDSVTSSRSCGYALAREMGIPTARRRIFLDNSSRPEEIRAQVVELGRLAEAEGNVVAIGHARETTLQVLAEELPHLKEQGITLVKVSAVLE